MASQKCKMDKRYAYKQFSNLFPDEVVCVVYLIVFLEECRWSQACKCCSQSDIFMHTTMFEKNVEKGVFEQWL